MTVLFKDFIYLIIVFCITGGLFYLTQKKILNMFTVSLWIIGLYPAIIEIVKPRYIDVNQGLLITNNGGIWTYLSSLLTFIILYIGVIGTVFALLQKKNNKNYSETMFWLSYMSFFIGILLSAVLGTVPTFSKSLFLFPLLITMAYLIKTISLISYVKNLKLICLFYVYASMLSLIFFPEWSVIRPYHGIIPFTDIRLFGVSSHPNILGPIAVLFILLEVFYPSSKKIRIINLLSSLIVILLAQSKTAFICLLIGVLVKLLYDFIFSNKKKKIFLLISTLIVGIAFLLSVIYFMNNQQHNLFNKLFYDNASDIESLTGRTTIWSITLNTWKSSPLFGYGPSIWGEYFRNLYKMPYAGQAHNQFIQALGESGIVGLCGLLVLMVCMVYYAIKCFVNTKGASLALVLLLILRTITEVPLRNYYIDNSFFVAFAVVSFLLISLKNQNRSYI